MQDRLRICIISLRFSPTVSGGALARAEKQARRFQSLGHEVIVITLRVDKKWAKKENLDGLSIVRIGGMYRRTGLLRMGRLGYIPISIIMLITLWQLRHRYEVIHVYQIAFFAAVATLIGELLHKPVIISSQNTGPTKEQLAQLEREPMLMSDTLPASESLKIDFKDWAEGGDDIATLGDMALGGRMIVNFLRKSNAYYQVLSTRGHKHLIGHNFRHEQIVHISGSVDTGKFRPLSEQRPDPSRPERNILCIARLEYSKGVDVLLHAWARMMQSRSEGNKKFKPRLLLVGEGKLEPQMVRIAHELNILDSVEFLGLRTDVLQLLQHSWGFVLPSRWEGMSNALLEAMACGLPCIATRVSGSEDVISNGINGLLVEPEQPTEMAIALQRIIEDTDLAQRLGKEGCATVLRNYQLIHVAEQCLGLYRYLLTKNENTYFKMLRAKEVPLKATASKAQENTYINPFNGGKYEG